MPFERKQIDLNILAADSTAATPAFMLPDGASELTAQFFYSDLQTDALLTLEQSTDGVNFDPVIDLCGDPVSVVLDKNKPSSTLNQVYLLTLFIRFQVNFNGSLSGSVNSVYYLTA